MDITKGEATERELDAMIERHHDRRVASEGEHLEEELWQVSARVHNAQLKQEYRQKWIAFYLSQAMAAERNGQIIAEENRTKAAKLMEPGRSQGAA